MKILLSEFEYVVTAWAEKPCGPGWSNRVVWVLVYDSTNGKYRLDSLQPEDQPDAMIEVFDYSALSSAHMKVLAEQGCAKRKAQATGRTDLDKRSN